jgi:hypothetical protein
MPIALGIIIANQIALQLFARHYPTLLVHFFR